MNQSEPIFYLHGATALVLDDHSLFADSFSKLLESFFLFNKVEFFTEESMFIRSLISISQKKNVYIFIDYYLKDKTALSIIYDVKRIYNAAKIIMITNAENVSIVNNLTSSKINGILSKYCDTEELLHCIKEVENGYQYVAHIFRRLLENNPVELKVPFTAREIEIIQFAAQGLTVDITAQKMNLSRHTIAAHKRKIFAKAKCHSTSELLQLTRKNGWI